MTTKLLVLGLAILGLAAGCDDSAGMATETQCQGAQDALVTESCALDPLDADGRDSVVCPPSAHFAGCIYRTGNPLASTAHVCVDHCMVCAPRAGRRYTATYVSYPGNDCGDIATHAVFFTDDGTSCVTVENDGVHSTTTNWTADGSIGRGTVTYASAHKVGGGTCSGSWSVIYTADATQP